MYACSARARAQLPDVILMDINLPGISGIEALNILREDPATTGMCVVAGSSRRIFRASIPLMPGRLMSIRITSGSWARARAEHAYMWVILNYLLDQHQVGRIVFHIEQGAQRRVSLSLRRKFCGHGISSGKLRRNVPDQFNPEFAAHSDGAFHADCASHQFDQLLGYHQADARPFLGAGLLPETIERLK